MLTKRHIYFIFFFLLNALKSVYLNRRNYLSVTTVYEHNYDNNNENLNKVCGHSLGLNDQWRYDWNWEMLQSIYTLLMTSHSASFGLVWCTKLETIHTFMASPHSLRHFVFHQMRIDFVTWHANESIGSCKSIYISVGAN